MTIEIILYCTLHYTTRVLFELMYLMSSRFSIYGDHNRIEKKVGTGIYWTTNAQYITYHTYLLCLWLTITEYIPSTIPGTYCCSVLHTTTSACFRVNLNNHHFNRMKLKTFFLHFNLYFITPLSLPTSSMHITYNH